MTTHSPPHSLQFYGVARGLTVATAIEAGARYGFRVHGPKSSTFYDKDIGFRAPADCSASRQWFSSPLSPTTLERGFRHMNGEEFSSPFISLSLCPIWPIWWILHRVAYGEIHQGIKFHVVDLHQIFKSESSILANELIEAYDPSMHAKLRRRHGFHLKTLAERANCAQEVLVAGQIPAKAIISTLPIETVIRSLPPGMVFEDNYHTCMMMEQPLHMWPWHQYLRTPGFSKFIGFLHHCRTQVIKHDISSRAWLRFSGRILYSTFLSAEEALELPDVRHLSSLFLHRFDGRMLTELCVNTSLLLEFTHFMARKFFPPYESPDDRPDWALIEVSHSLTEYMFSSDFSERSNNDGRTEGRMELRKQMEDFLAALRQTHSSLLSLLEFLNYYSYLKPGGGRREAPLNSHPQFRQGKILLRDLAETFKAATSALREVEHF